MMTSYFLGSSIRMPPIFTNSPVTPWVFIELIFSTNAGGKVFSIPKRIPIFLFAILKSSSANEPHCFRQPVTFTDELLKIFRRHPLPKRPIMLTVIPVNIQPMRNAFAAQNCRHLHVRVQAHVPIRRSEHNLHLPVAAQKPLVTGAWQIVRRIVEVNVVIVIA